MLFRPISVWLAIELIAAFLLAFIVRELPLVRPDIQNKPH